MKYAIWSWNFWKKLIKLPANFVCNYGVRHDAVRIAHVVHIREAKCYVVKWKWNPVYESLSQIIKFKPIYLFSTISSLFEDGRSCGDEN